MEDKKRKYALLNKVMVIGRLTKDAEVRYLDSSSGNGQIQLTTFTIALDGAANYGQETAFVDFSHLGDFPVSEHLLKGRLVHVEGQIAQLRKEVEGKNRTFTNFQCDRLTLLSSPPAPKDNPLDEEDFADSMAGAGFPDEIPVRTQTSTKPLTKTPLPKAPLPKGKVRS